MTSKLTSERIRKLQALADPSRNPNVHEARAAQEKVWQLLQASGGVVAGEELWTAYKVYLSIFRDFIPVEDEWLLRARQFLEEYPKLRRRDVIEFRRERFGENSQMQKILDGLDVFVDFMRERMRKGRP